MLCSDLDRYLEIHLDGRLGRSRTAILRRHLAACGTCRARVDLLRRFERDLAASLGGGGRGEHGSVWHGLEADLVRSVPAGGAETAPLLRALPPGGAPRPARHRREVRPGSGGRRELPAPQGGNGGSPPKLAGVLAVTLALGTLYELARPGSGPRDPAEAAVQAYLNVVAGGPGLTLRTDDPVKLQDWLKEQLGPASPVPPSPTVSGSSAAPGRTWRGARRPWSSTPRPTRPRPVRRCSSCRPTTPRPR
jgi:hypothetical protein